MSVRVAISMGDYNGIGPEIILKALQIINFEDITPVIFGHETVFRHYADLLDFENDTWNTCTNPDEITNQQTNLINCVDSEQIKLNPGTFSTKAGLAAMLSVENGIKWCMQNHTDALVTAPISKEAVNKAGYNIPGHTEFLAKNTNANEYMMMLVHESLRVGLATIHIPVSQIAGFIKKPMLLKRIKTMNQALQNDFSIANPRIAVLGLNPHAGDGGIIGKEEIETITPAIVDSESNGFNVSGPYPADGFFGNKKYKHFDGVLAMYHDQGLVPFKTLSFGGGVNVTTGLSIVRTSPDHGTAFDIAGQGKANPASFLEALSLASSLSKNRLQKKAK